MTMQLAASLERMTHTWRIIYYRVGGHLHLNLHLKGRTEHRSLSLFGVLNLWTSHTRHFAELNNDTK